MKDGRRLGTCAFIVLVENKIVHNHMWYDIIAASSVPAVPCQMLLASCFVLHYSTFFSHVSSNRAHMLPCAASCCNAAPCIALTSYHVIGCPVSHHASPSIAPCVV